MKQKYFKNLSLFTPFLLFIVQVMTSCNYFSKEKQIVYDSKPLARVYNTNLYESDIPALLSDKKVSDSSAVINTFIDTWIRRQLMLHQAEIYIDYNKKEIEDKVAEYRYSLLVYEYQKQFVDKHLDTTIRFDEVKKYYDQNKDNFVLKQNIIRASYLVLPLETPKLNKLKNWFVSVKPADKKELFSYCLQFAAFFVLDDTTWYYYNELLKDSPFEKVHNQVEFLSRNPITEASDSLHFYLLKVFEYKMEDEISPLSLVKETIINTLIHKRKIRLIRELEQEIYETAKKNKDFEILIKTDDAQKN